SAHVGRLWERTTYQGLGSCRRWSEHWRGWLDRSYGDDGRATMNGGLLVLTAALVACGSSDPPVVSSPDRPSRSPRHEVRTMTASQELANKLVTDAYKPIFYWPQ